MKLKPSEKKQRSVRARQKASLPECIEERLVMKLSFVHVADRNSLKTES